MCSVTKVAKKLKESEINCLPRQKNSTEILFIHKGTRMVIKNEEDQFGLTKNFNNFLNFSRCAHQDVAR